MEDAFDREFCKKLSAEIESALSDIASKYKLELKTCGGSFDSASFSLKLKCTKLTIEGDKTWSQGIHNIANAQVDVRGFDREGKNILGQTIFTNDGQEFKVVDFKTRGIFNFIIENPKGKRYKTKSHIFMGSTL